MKRYGWVIALPRRKKVSIHTRRPFSMHLLILIASSVTMSLTLADAAGPATSFYDYPAATGNITPVGKSPPVTGTLLRYGEWLYRGLCIRCHGPDGDGQGADWTLTEYNPEYWLPRQPRDFTEAVFKLRSTPSGSLPTDRDLFETISRGLVPAQDMPSFMFLPERDRWALVAYVKTFSDRWREERDYQEPPIVIPGPPAPTADRVTQGKRVYAEMRCAKCHGESGKGDGPSAGELTDDNDLPIVPRDFTDPSQFLGPSDPQGIYRTFTTGLDGTPMPSFADFLDEQQRWQLVWYVMSLRPKWSLEQARCKLKQQGVHDPPEATLPQH